MANALKPTPAQIQALQFAEVGADPWKLVSASTCRALLKRGLLERGEKKLHLTPAGRAALHHAGAPMLSVSAPVYEEAEYDTADHGPRWCLKHKGIVLGGSKRCGTCGAKTVPLYVKVTP